MKVSVQLYTLRKQAGRDLHKTLAQLSAVGYHAVEAARIPFTAQTADIFRRCREEFALEVRSSQVKYPVLKNQFSEMSAWLHSTGCGIVVVSMLPLDVLRGGEDAMQRFCDDLNQLGARYAGEGIRLAFHHHHYEFLMFGSRRGIDIMLDAADPKCVGFVSDTYWAQRAGANPEALLARLQGRLVGVHLRDFTTVRVGPFLRASDCAVGRGLLNMAAVLKQARVSGADYCAVEQNSPQPLQDIAASRAAVERLIGEIADPSIIF